MGIGKGTGPGGARPGAGRRKGGQNMPPEEMSRLAKRHTRRALNIIRHLAEYGETDSVRLNACRELLDRGFGKAPQSMRHGGEDGGPIPFTFDFDGNNGDQEQEATE